MRICVLGSSSAKTTQIIQDESYKLGEILAEKQIVCVNGGGKTGVMGNVNEGCMARGGTTLGVIHEMFCFDGEESNHLTKTVVVNGGDLHARKRKLFVLSDALIFMPGGTGTYDELWDAISARSLRLRMMSVEKRDSVDAYKPDVEQGLDRLDDFKRKPIVVVNIDGFFDNVRATLEKMSEHKVLYAPIEEYYHVVSNVQEAVDYCIQELAAFDILPGTSDSEVIVDKDITAVRLQTHELLREKKINLREASVASAKADAASSGCVITKLFACPGKSEGGKTCPFACAVKLAVPLAFGFLGYYIGRKSK